MSNPKLVAHIGTHFPDSALPRIAEFGTKVHNVWVEARLDEEWTCAYRLLEQDGQIVVGELRVFPIEKRKRGEPARKPGEWSAKWLGVEAKAPPGGLTARKLRRVRFDDTRRFIGDALETIRGRVARNPSVAEILGAFRIYATEGMASTSGRKPLPAEEYTELAARYVAKVQVGVPEPIAELAAETHYERSRIRWALRRARDEGLLTGTSRGRAGGSLTDKALAILAERVHHDEERGGDDASQRPGRERQRRRRSGRVRAPLPN
jgi:hypothetical protein